jgi:uncharacterized protein YndB with AHSA1/START domain
MTATARTGTTTYSTPSDREIELVRVVQAPRTLVFAAYTEPAHLRHWLLGPDGWSMSVCEIDARPGGRQRYVWSRADGTQMQIAGEIIEVFAPERLVSTESWGEDWPETVNTVVLTEQDGLTTITTTMRFPSKDARDAALRTGMEGGLEDSYRRLDAYLAGVITAG